MTIETNADATQIYTPQMSKISPHLSKLGANNESESGSAISYVSQTQTKTKASVSKSRISALHSQATSRSRKNRKKESLSDRLVRLVENTGNNCVACERRVPMTLKLGFMVVIASILLIVACIIALLPPIGLMEESVDVEKIVDFASLISDFAHQTQLERGNCGLFISGGSAFEDALRNQIISTDEQLTKLVDYMADFSEGLFGDGIDGTEGKDNFNGLNFYVKSIDDHRQRVLAGDYTIAEATGYYTTMNSYGFLVIHNLGLNISLRKVSRYLRALEYFLWHKDLVGIVRALGAAAMNNNKHASINSYLALLGQESASLTYLELFKRNATPDDVEYYDSYMKHPSVDITDSMLSVLKQDPTGGNWNLTGSHFFGNMTAKINRLKVIEAQILEDVVEQSDMVVNTSRRTLGLVITFMICSILGLMITSIWLSAAIYISHRITLRSKNTELYIAESVAQSIAVLELETEQVNFLMNKDEAHSSDLDLALRDVVTNMREFKQFIPESIQESLKPKIMEELDDVAKDNDESEGRSVLTDLQRDVSNPHGLLHQSIIQRQQDIRSKYGLIGKDVSILIVNIESFHQLQYTTDPSRMTALHADIVHLVSKVVKENGGTFHGFNGDYSTASFNSVTRCFNYQERACRSALQIQSTIAKRHQPEWTSCGLPKITVNYSVTSGRLLCGNIGSATSKSYANIGQKASFAYNMVKYNKKYELPSRVLIDNDTYEKVKNNFSAFILDAGTVKHMSYRSQKSSTALIFCLAGEKDILQSEWMYELDSQQKSVSTYEPAIQKIWAEIVQDNLDMARDAYSELQGQIKISEGEVSLFQQKSLEILENHFKRMESTGCGFRCYF